MFETHQQEAKTARDKRDREEIEQLKKQVQCTIVPRYIALSILASSDKLVHCKV